MGLVWIFLLALAFMPTCFGLSFFIVYQIWLIRRPEPFFNQTPALRKLYEFAKENNIRLIRTGDSWSIGCFGLSLNFLFVGKNIRFALSRNGLEEIAFAHELGHFLIFFWEAGSVNNLFLRLRGPARNQLLWKLG